MIEKIKNLLGYAYVILVALLGMGYIDFIAYLTADSSVFFWLFVVFIIVPINFVAVFVILFTIGHIIEEFDL